MSRGLEELNAAISATNMVIPTKDIPILGYDKIVCRIIKFGKMNEMKWKGKDGKPDNTTQHIRVYIHVYSFFEAVKQDFRKDLENKVITVNPRVAWLPEMVALQRALEEDSGDKEELFRHKVQIFRRDKKNPNGEGNFGYLEFSDLGLDDTFRDDDHETIVEVHDRPREVDHVEEFKQEPSFSEKLKTTTTVEDANKLAKQYYDSESNTDKQAGILKEYRVHRDLLIEKMVATSANKMEVANQLAAKYYSKEPKKAAELLETAKSLSGTEDSEEDIPF